MNCPKCDSNEIVINKINFKTPYKNPITNSSIVIYDAKQYCCTNCGEYWFTREQEDFISGTVNKKLCNLTEGENLKVYSEAGALICNISPTLLERQKAWHNLERIKTYHRARFNIEQEMDSSEKDYKVKSLFKVWTDIQYKLQIAWGFEKNSNFHRDFELNKCNCPKMDNYDMYPFGKVYSEDCIIHGK